MWTCKSFEVPRKQPSIRDHVPKHLRKALVAIAAVPIALSACGESVGVPQNARVQILLTDAPSDYVGEAFVDIGAVELLPSGEGDRIVLSEDGTDGPINLLDLQGLTTEVLADVDIPAGTYHQLRLFVESASVTLADGYEFRDGSTESDLRVPSGAQSGIKLRLRPDAESDMGEGDGDGEGGVEIAGGETILVVDFDVNQSFRIQGNPNTPAGINGVSFRPTLRVVVQDLAGSMAGTVSTSLQDTPVEGLVVSAETVDPGDDEEFQSRVATAVTDSVGGYTIHFLAPGTYTVTVAAGEGLTTDPASVEVVVEASEDVEGIDFAVVTGA
jgi:hypothetical protein